MVKKLLTTLVALLTIVAAAISPVRAQGQPVQLTLTSNNFAMGRAEVARHSEYVLYDSFTPSNTNGTRSNLYNYYVPVSEGAWINTAGYVQSWAIISDVIAHHLTLYNANGQSAEMALEGKSFVEVFFLNGNAYKNYECTELIIDGAITRVEVYGEEIVLPDGVTKSATAGVYYVAPGTEVPVAAMPRTHHYLTHWSNNATTDTVTVTVNEAMTLTANFGVSPVLTLVTNNAQMGGVEIPRHAGEGLIATFKASDFAGQNIDNYNFNGYYFDRPSVPENGTEWNNISEDYTQPLSISTHNSNQSGNGKNKLKVVFYGPNGNYYEYVGNGNNSNDQYQVFLKNGNTYSDWDDNSLLWQGGVNEIEIYGPGNVLPAGVAQITGNTFSVGVGTVVPVVANANLRHHFVSWSNNSTEAQTSFTMPATATTLTANFATNPTLTLTANPANSGSVELDFEPTPQTLTVNDGTVTLQQVPIYLCFLDASNTRGQHIIPADQLNLMAGGTINSITYYIENNDNWTSTSQVNVYLKEVENTILTAYEESSSATPVYTGTLSLTDGLMTVTFSEPYTYQGGNLLVGIDNPNGGNFTCRSFLGVSAPSGSSAGDYGGIFTLRSFLPKATFNYTPVLPVGVLANSDGSYNVVPGTQLTLKATGTEGFSLRSWSNNAEVNTDGTQTFTMPATATTLTANFVKPQTLMGIPEGWAVTADNESVTANNDGTYTIAAGAAVKLIPPTEEKPKVKNVTVSPTPVQEATIVFE